MSATYSFACPHCAVVNAVPASTIGQVWTCSTCARPFRAEIPVAQAAVPKPEMSAPKIEPASASAPESAPADDKPTVILRVHPALLRARWVASGCDLVLVLGGAALALWAFFACEPGIWRWFFLGGGGLLWLVGKINLVIPWLRARGETLEVSGEATRWSKGVFKRRSVEIRHDAVRAVEVEQTLSQRLFGIGTLTLASDGADHDEIVMQAVPQVRHVADIIRSQQRHRRK